MKRFILNVENLRHVNESKDSIYLIRTNNGVSACSQSQVIVSIKDKDGVLFNSKKLPPIKL